MTATSFHALRHTLEDRLAAMQSGNPPRLQQPDDEADAEPTDPDGEVLAPDEVAVLERQALAQEEKDDIARLLEDIRKLPPDTKSGCLCEELDKLRTAGYAQTMVSTSSAPTPPPRASTSNSAAPSSITTCRGIPCASNNASAA